MKNPSNPYFSFVASSLAFIIEVLLFCLFIPTLFVLMLPYTRFRIALKKLLHCKPTILWAPVNIINISANRLADRTQGFKSDCLVYTLYNITQADLFDYHLDRFYHDHRLLNIVPRALPYIVMAWAGFTYDIFHFYYIGGFLYAKSQWIVKLEFIFWKLIGKKTIVCPYGADVRLEATTRKLGKYHSYLDFSHNEVLQEVGPDMVIESRVKFILRWATVAISGYDMIEYTPGSNNNLFFWAINTKDWQPIYDPGNEDVVIVHAPNNPRYKGTRFLLPIIERLRHEGLPIRFIMIQNMSNADARKQYEKADIFAEQFIGGSHGFTAIEAMALGKPVVAFLLKKEYFPGWVECPIVNANPDTLYDTLLKLVRDKGLRQQLGRQGRAYVEQVYAVEKVGERLKNIYADIW